MLALVVMLKTNVVFLCLVILTFIITNIFYNHPKFNWKGKPFYSALSSFTGGSLGFLAGYYSTPRNFTAHSLLEALPYGICILSGALMTMIPDIAGDRQTHKHTIPIMLGSKKTLILIISLNMVNIIITPLLQTYEVGLASFFSAALGIYCYIKQKYNDTSNIKISIILPSMLICKNYPFYLLIATVYFFISRIYYRKRFNIKYP